jgi:dTDP-4-dehydrorhamnose 3,5-epimerase-like enzyme
MSLVHKIDLPTFTDGRGGLVVVEAKKQTSFDFERVYFIYGNGQNEARGFHAHRELQQLAICVAGSCKVVLDDGDRREDVLLEQPNEGLLIDKMIWREMNSFSPDCVLLVLASKHFDEADYIRDYDEFKALKESGQYLKA